MKTNGLYHDQGTAHWTDHHNVVQLGARVQIIRHARTHALIM